MLVLDSGAVSYLSRRTSGSAAVIRRLRHTGLWPAMVPSPVLVECLRGDSRRDAATNRFLKTTLIRTDLPIPIARRAAELRRRAGRGSAIDAIVIASAEPHGTVLTSDMVDLEALAAQTDGVQVARV